MQYGKMAWINIPIHDIPIIIRSYQNGIFMSSAWQKSGHPIVSCGIREKREGSNGHLGRAGIPRSLCCMAEGRDFFISLAFPSERMLGHLCTIWHAPEAGKTAGWPPLRAAAKKLRKIKP